MEKNIFKLLEELHRQSLTTDIVPITQFRKQPSTTVPIGPESLHTSSKECAPSKALSDISLRHIIESHTLM